MAYMFDRKPLNHPQIRLSVRSVAPALRNFSVITFHCLGPFPYKNALKTRTQPTFSRFDLMGVIFKEGGNPPHHQLSTLLARSKNGRANQINAQPGVRKKPKWRPVVWASFYWNHVLLDQKTCFSMSKYRTSHF